MYQLDPLYLWEINIHQIYSTHLYLISKYQTLAIYWLKQSEIFLNRIKLKLYVCLFVCLLVSIKFVKYSKVKRLYSWKKNWEKKYNKQYYLGRHVVWRPLKLRDAIYSMALRNFGPRQNKYVAQFLKCCSKFFIT